MATRMGTIETLAAIHNIIKEAEEGIVLISPYINMPTNLRDAIKYAAKKKVHVLIIYRDNKSFPNEFDWVPVNSPYIQIRQYSNFHAKMYFNEKQAVDGSLNLLRSSFERNEENGTLWEKDGDLEEYVKIVKQYQVILSGSKLIRGKEFVLFSEHIGSEVSTDQSPPIRNGKQSSKTTAKGSNSKKLTKKPEKGFCMDCGKEMDFDPEMPSCCNRNYWKWSIFADRSEPQEKGYCHICGEKCHPTFRVPLCPSCEKNNRKWIE